MLVDPEVLRAFAGQVDSAAAVITGADIGNKTSSAAGEHFSQMAEQLAQNVTRMGEAVRRAGDTFEAADDALASDFDGLF